MTKEELQKHILRFVEDIDKKNFNQHSYDKNNIQEDLDTVGYFLILWSLFERICCNTYANKSTIDCVIENVKDSFSDTMLNEAFGYMKERYKDKEKFKNLRFRETGGKVMKEHCENTFSDEEASKEDKLKTVLYIIYRYRNNLFHGSKQIPALQQQKDNFNMAYKVLIECIEKYERKNTRKDLSVGKKHFR